MPTRSSRCAAPAFQSGQRLGPLLPWALAFALFTWLAWAPPAPVQRLDLMVHDHSGALRPPPANTDSVIVAIDERSLQALGRWPWKRHIHAELLQRLQAAGVRSVAYDVLFSERMDQPQDADADDADQQLARAIAAFGRVVLPVAPTVATVGIRPLLPLPELARAAAVIGHVDVELDMDSVARRFFLRAGTDGQTWEALPLALLRLHGQARAEGETSPCKLEPCPGPAVLQHPEGSSRTPRAWHREGERLLPTQSTPVPVLSFVDVLDDPAIAATLANRAVFVGMSVEGLGDRIPAPGGQHWSGVQWHANVYEALRAERLATPAPPIWTWLGGTVALGLMFVLSFSSHARSGAMAALLLVPLLGSVLLLSFASIWVDVTAATLSMATGMLLWRTRLYRHTRQALERMRGRSDAALRAIADSVVVVDVRGAVVDMNPVAARLAGRSLQNAQGSAVADLFRLDPADRKRVEDAVQECLRKDAPVRCHAALRVTTDDGERRLRLAVSPVAGTRRTTRGAVLALNDVTDVISAEERLQFEATHDPLTGLPNRVLLGERLSNAIAAAQRDGREIAVMFVDLDRFKRINDSLGHRLGDTVLKTIAQRLVQACRPTDTVARWGGDEFVIVMEHFQGQDEVARIAERLVQSVSQDVSVDDIDVHTSCSIGIAMSPLNGVVADDLLAMADAAMYRGKSGAGQRHEFYAADMSVGSRDGLALETRLRLALSRQEFELYYQPQVRVSDGCIVGLEALLRWRLHDGALLTPGQFIGVAEEAGVILPIGTWVIEEAVRQLRRWQAAGIPTPTMCINVSARQCLDRGLVRQVAEILRSAPLAPGSLMFEITETTAMRDVDHVASLLHELRALGVGVALDDFGTGYSSLAHLKCLPIDQIKIDQSFVRDIVRDRQDEAIVSATIALARGLQIPVLAEGVETEEQARSLERHGCELAQGFLYAAPMEAERMTAMLCRPAERLRSGRSAHALH